MPSIKEQYAQEQAAYYRNILNHPAYATSPAKDALDRMATPQYWLDQEVEPVQLWSQVQNLAAVDDVPPNEPWATTFAYGQQRQRAQQGLPVTTTNPEYLSMLQQESARGDLPALTMAPTEAYAAPTAASPQAPSTGAPPQGLPVPPSAPAPNMTAPAIPPPSTGVTTSPGYNAGYNPFPTSRIFPSMTPPGGAPIFVGGGVTTPGGTVVPQSSFAPQMVTAPQPRVAGPTIGGEQPPLSVDNRRNLVGEGANTLAAQVDLAPDIFAAYSQFAPQFAQTDMNVLRSTLFGQFDAGQFEAANPGFLAEYQRLQSLGELKGWTPEQFAAAYIGKAANDPSLNQYYSGGMNSINQFLTQQANEQTLAANTALRGGNVADAAAFGPQALALMQQLNPNQYAAMNQLQQQASGGIAPNQFQQQLGQQFAAGPSFSPVGAPTVTGQNVQAGQFTPAVVSPGQISTTAIAPSMLGPQERVSSYNNPLLASASAGASNLGFSPLGSDLQAMARSELALGRDVSPDALRRAEQAEREAWTARGLAFSPGAVASEILARDDVANKRLMERQAFASSVNQLGMAQEGMNRDYTMGLIGAGATQGAQGLQAQLANQNVGFQAGLANQDNLFRSQAANQQAGLTASQANLGALMQGQLANQQAGLVAGQANVDADLRAQLANQQNQYQSQLATGQFQQQAGMANQAAQQQALAQNQQLGLNLAGMDYSRQQQGFGNTLANAQFQAGAAFNPFATITSAGSANQGTNPALFGMGGNVTSGATANQATQSMFNPFNAYSSDLFNTNANAGWAQQINADNRKAGLWQGAMSMVGNILGGPLGGKICWIAREVYGEQNPKWLLFRSWLLNNAPSELRRFYITNGEAIAAYIHDMPDVKARLRDWMDLQIKSLNPIKGGT